MEMISELIENDNEFKESDVWTVVEGYEYPQLKENPHLHSKEVIPALKNYSFETAVSEGIYSIKYNWTLPQGIKELKIKGRQARPTEVGRTAITASGG